MLNLIKITKPNIGKYNPGSLFELIGDPDVAASIEQTSSPEYIYYDRIRNEPLNDKDMFWALVKLQRRFSAKPVPPVNFNERHFTLNNIFAHSEILYRLGTQKLEGELIDEVAHSSSIENSEIGIIGAKKLLLEATHPKNEAEKLVKNAMKIYSSVLASDKLVLEPSRFRSEAERFVHSPHKREMICYIAPSSRILERELPRMLAFANDELEHEFLHPVVKAVILHFWFLILNPLPENNGIYARAVQYWYLKKHNITLPVSKFVRADLAGYSRAISCSAQDDNDITYFVDYMLHKLESAAHYRAQDQKRQHEFERRILPELQLRHGLNQRQVMLVYELARIRTNRTNFSSYMAEHKISRKTAADDLKELERKGYIKSSRIGKNIFYVAIGAADNILL